MNPFVCKVTCSVCGEPGMATPDVDAYSWDSRYSIAHSDPRVCSENLARKARQLKQREEALVKEQEALTAPEAKPQPVPEETNDPFTSNFF